MTESKKIEETIHSTRAWQALHLEVQAEILDDVKINLAKALQDAGLIFKEEIEKASESDKDKKIRIAKTVRVYSCWDIGDEDCYRIADALISKGLIFKDEVPRLNVNAVVRVLEEYEEVVGKSILNSRLRTYAEIICSQFSLPEINKSETLNIKSLTELESISKQIQSFADRFSNGG